MGKADGLAGTCLLAVPVLAGSATYATGEAFGWHLGLARKLGRAPAFYATIAIATIIGAGLKFTPIDPIKALFGAPSSTGWSPCQ